MGPPISRVNFHPSEAPVIFFGPLKKNGGYRATHVALLITYNDRSAPGALILFDPLIFDLFDLQASSRSVELGCPRIYCIHRTKRTDDGRLFFDSKSLGFFWGC